MDFRIISGGPVWKDKAQWFFSFIILCVTPKKRKILHKVNVLPGQERSRGQSSQSGQQYPQEEQDGAAKAEQRRGSGERDGADYDSDQGAECQVAGESAYASGAFQAYHSA